VAGTASGLLGTSSSIGGPPVALLYQHSPGPEIRSSLAAFMTIGSALSVTGLAVGGQVDAGHLRSAAFLAPFLVVGFLLSEPVRKLLDPGPIRQAVLVVAAVSALALIARSAIG